MGLPEITTTVSLTHSTTTYLLYPSLSLSLSLNNNNINKQMMLQKSQLAKLVLLLWLIITPFISASFRLYYIYFFLNILIIALGIEAGLLSAPSGPFEEKKAMKVITPVTVDALPQNESGDSVVNSTKLNVSFDQAVKTAEKPAVKKIVAVARVHKVKRSPSTPSLFFIGGFEGEGQFKEQKLGEEGLEEGEELSAQELFAKAETFIGNFYKQLKMQREESWKKIHGLYHRPF